MSDQEPPPKALTLADRRNSSTVQAPASQKSAYGMIYVALYDYDGLTADELSVEVGQEIRFIAQEGEW